MTLVLGKFCVTGGGAATELVKNEHCKPLSQCTMCYSCMNVMHHLHIIAYLPTHELEIQGLTITFCGTFAMFAGQYNILSVNIHQHMPIEFIQLLKKILLIVINQVMQDSTQL